MGVSTQLWRRHTLRGGAFSIPMAVLAAAYLATALDLPSAAWRELVLWVAVLVGPAFALGIRAQRRMAEPFLRWCDGEDAGPLPRVLESAIALPAKLALAGFATWAAGVAAMVVVGWWRIEGFGLFASLATILCGLAAAAVSSLFSYFTWQASARTEQRRLATRVPVADRLPLKRAIPLGVKLQLSLFATGVVPLLMAVLLAHTDRNEVHWGMVAVAVGAGAFAFGLGHAMTRETASMAKALSQALDRFAAGDLREPAGLDSDDELGSLARSADEVREGLAGIVRKVDALVAAISGETHELANAAAAVSAASEEQRADAERASDGVGAVEREVGGIAQESEALARSVGESSAAIEELRATGDEIRDLAAGVAGRVDEASEAVAAIAEGNLRVSAAASLLSESAREAQAATEQLHAASTETDRRARASGELAATVRELSGRGRGAVRAVAAGIGEIDAAVGENESITRTLRGAVEEIGGVVAVIDEIGSDTQLLSLNAAIIASQAGEHGRAFSVVAAEVKALAGRVLRRTDEVTRIIDAVDKVSADAAAATRRSRDAVERGRGLSDEASAALAEIETSVHDGDEHAKVIAHAMAQQNEAVTHLRQVVARVHEEAAQIDRETTEQTTNQSSVVEVANAVRESVRSVETGAREQAASLAHLRDGVLIAEEASGRIQDALGNQRTQCEGSVTAVAGVAEHARSNQASVQALEDAIAALRQRAAGLREVITRIELD